MALNDEQVRRYEEIRRVKERIAGEFLARPDIDGVGVGFKWAGGRSTELLAIIFYVKKKREVPAGEALPSAIEGVPTDVIQLDIRRTPPSDRPSASGPEAGGADVSAVDKDKYDPLLGGISIGRSKSFDYSGTLGLMVRDANTGAPMMLSNAHVMCGSNTEKGDDICQPARVDITSLWCSNCAELERWFVGNYKKSGVQYGMDAAVALRTHRGVSYAKIVDIGTINGADMAKAGMLGDKVLKRGKETGLKEGRLESVDADYKTTDEKGVEVSLYNQMTISPQAFSKYGDSGAVVVTDAGQIAVGLLWGGDPDSGWGIASQIVPIAEKLKIRLT